MRLDKRVWHWRTYIIKYAPANPTYRHVLLTLSLYMDEVGRSCFPSVQTLCEDTALAKPTVIKYLHQAKDDGWITIEKHGFAGQKWKRNEYTASIPNKVVKEVNSEPKGGKPENKGGKPDSTKVVKEVNSNTTENTSSNNTPTESDRLSSLPEDKRKEFEQIEEKSKYLLTVPIPDKITLADEYWIRKWLIHLSEMNKRMTTFAQEEMLHEMQKLHSIKDTVRHNMSKGYMSLIQREKDSTSEKVNFVQAPEDY